MTEARGSQFCSGKIQRRTAGNRAAVDRSGRRAVGSGGRGRVRQRPASVDRPIIAGRSIIRWCWGTSFPARFPNWASASPAGRWATASSAKRRPYRSRQPHDARRAVQSRSLATGFGYGVDGAMTRFVRVPARLLHRVPTNLPWEVAALTEPCCVAYNAVVNHSTIQPGDRVVVLRPWADRTAMRRHGPDARGHGRCGGTGPGCGPFGDRQTLWLHPDGRRPRRVVTARAMGWGWTA